MSEIDQTVAPNSTALRAQARREAFAMCQAMEAKAKDDLAKLKLAQSEELARAHASAKTSVARTWLTGVVVGVLGLGSMLLIHSRTPQLSEDGERVASVSAMETRSMAQVNTASAERELAKRAGGGYRERAANETTEGACNEWDPLAFCIR